MSRHASAIACLISSGLDYQFKMGAQMLLLWPAMDTTTFSKQKNCVSLANLNGIHKKQTMQQEFASSKA